jgi:alpha-D-xyloside xylohydrolase
MKYEKKQNLIIVRDGESMLCIEVFSEGIVRIKRSSKKSDWERKGLVVDMQTGKIEYNVQESSRGIVIDTGKVKVIVNESNKLITFYDAIGRTLLSERARSCEMRPVIVSKEKCYSVAQGFDRDAQEGLYGLGQYEEGFVNYRNCEVLMIQANRVIVNPFLVSTRGYGILWDNYSQSKFIAGVTDYTFSSEVADGIDYYFLFGGSIDGTIREYRKLTGTVPMFPKWVFGFWQSKERYLDQDELVYIVEEYRARKIPIDCIVQDWRYWGENEVFSGMTWEKHRFPDPKGMMKKIHSLHAHLMASFWPAFGPQSPIYKEMAAKGFLFEYPHWTGSRVYDAFSERGRNIYWKHLKRCLFDNDVDAYWMDGTEPEFTSAEDRFILAETVTANRDNELGTMARYLNAFSLVTTKGVYENQRAVSDNKRVFILTRSSFTGQQRYAAASWSGDTFASWGTLQAQICAAINFSLAGVPYWTCDVGAFYASPAYKNALTDPAFKELYVRWFQFVAFTPILRVHGTEIPREIWRFGEPGAIHYDTIAKFIKLRYRLLPYVYSMAWKVTNEGYSFIRALACEYPDDERSRETSAQYMFGTSLLVCPVTKELYGTTKNKGDYIYYRNLYTPDGKEHGLVLEAFDGLDFHDLRGKRKIDTSSMGSAGNIPLDIEREYSQRWTGKIRSNEPGVYEFTAITDGSLRLWFDGKLVIDQWSNREEKRFSFSVELLAETKYDIRLDHQQFRMKQAGMKLTWHTPEMASYEAKKSVDIYLPPAKKWYDFWTGKTIGGGKVIRSKPALDTMPLFVRAGSIVPMGPVLQYTTEKPADPIDLRVYTGADAESNLYEDEDDNYNYEKGSYSIVPFTWSEGTKTLSIGKRIGTFPGMLKTRTFNVVFVKKRHGTGLDETRKPDASVTYNGKEIRIRSD